MPALTGSQLNGFISTPPRPTIRVDQNRMDSVWSVRDNRRDTRSRRPLTAAPITGSKRAHSKLAAPGRIITSTPTKPTMIAIHTLRATFSPRTGADRAATKIGLAKVIAVTVASGNWLSALRTAKVPARNRPPRSNWPRQDTMLSMRGPPTDKAQTRITSSAANWRIVITWPIG